MEAVEQTRKTRQFEWIYTAVLLFVVAALLLASLAYTKELWWVKSALALGLLIFSTFCAWKYVRGRRRHLR